jgi:hypothetical protein
MAKRTTNADLIMGAARARLAVAEQEERDAAAELRLASAIVEVNRANLDAAEKLLTPKARKRADKPTVSAPALNEPSVDTEAKCSICGNAKDHADHDRTYVKSHDFELPKSVARASRKSKNNKEGASSTQTLETEAKSAGSAALAASGGD